jgi:hypothetical protein
MIACLGKSSLMEWWKRNMSPDKTMSDPLHDFQIADLHELQLRVLALEIRELSERISRIEARERTQ